jgi:hypothetical protein
MIESIEDVKELLPDDMFDSKCWKQDSVLEKIRCLLEWNKSLKEENDHLYDIIEFHQNENDMKRNYLK